MRCPRSTCSRAAHYERSTIGRARCPDGHGHRPRRTGSSRSSAGRRPCTTSGSCVSRPDVLDKPSRPAPRPSGGAMHRHPDVGAEMVRVDLRRARTGRGRGSCPPRALGRIRLSRRTRARRRSPSDGDASSRSPTLFDRDDSVAARRSNRLDSSDGRTRSAIIRLEAGSHFDPDLVDRFCLDGHDRFVRGHVWPQVRPTPTADRSPAAMRTTDRSRASRSSSCRTSGRRSSRAWRSATSAPRCCASTARRRSRAARARCRRRRTRASTATGAASAST